MLRFSKVSYSKKGVSCGLAAALMASAALTGSAEARNAGAIAAGIIGGVIAGAVIGSAVSNSRQQQRQPQRQVRERRPQQQQQAQRTNADSTRVVQQALASLGHYQGPVDGKMGKPTRDGISSFQKSLNDKPTGQLTRKQREVLLAAYAQNQQQGASQQAQAPVDNSLHKLLAGGAALGAGTMLGAQQAVAAPTAPNAQVFLASVCSQGGAPATPGVLLVGGQPQSVLPDQFCRARNGAISDAARLVTPEMARDVERLRTECRAATDQMSGYASASLSEPIPAITARLAREFQPLRQQNAVENAIVAYKICLGLGYQEDRADMVLASGLGLVGLGQGGHAEVIAAVVSQSPDRTRHAADWLDFAAGSIERGAPSLDAALGGERATVLRLASRQLRAGLNVAGGTQPVELNTPIRAPSFGAQGTPAPQQAAAQQTTAPQAAAPQATQQLAAVPTTPATSGAERLKGEAISFFEAEKAQAPSRLRQQLDALRLSQADLEKRCSEFSKPEDIASGKPVGEADLPVLNACRTLSYVNGRTAFMMAFDQRLADSGDKDAVSRMAFHRLAGH
jgi:uncharacterized membrane protein YebE (DUF533 family)